MNSGYTAVEASLNRAEFRWKWLRILRCSSILGIVFCLVVWGLGGAILAGWITRQTTAIAILAGLGAVGLAAWLGLLLGILSGAPDRSWLGAALERVDQRLLDRLNTLLFLERQPNEPKAESFAHHIARQAQDELSAHAPPPPFPATRSLEWVLGFAAVLGLTVLLLHSYAPWSHLTRARQRVAAQAPAPEKPLELAQPATNALEQSRAWGEIRITDPGTDLKVTKVDVVPLQIEAAANEPLSRVGWFSSVNGAPEAAHELPPPKEPRYAVYQPTLYLDEFNLSDWDVLTYYAKANTDKKDSYASEVYFVEVRPFREDILKMPGGEGGKPYHSLNEISSLITRQQHVIRQTHQHIQRPPPQESLQMQDRKKLADAEADLRDSSQHLYAKMAAEMENKPIGEALDNLAKAEKSLDAASTALQHSVLDEAQNRERSALSELVAARKMFQKAVTDNPSAFQDSDQNPQGDESPPVAENTKKLNQMAEFRNERKAAQDFVQKTLQQQKELHDRAQYGPRSQYSGLAEQQQQLQRSLQDFQQQHPQAFKGMDGPSQQAQQAMNQAADSLRQRSQQAGAATQEAAKQLEQFGRAMQSQAVEQQLADAYKLKQMLDQQAQALERSSQAEAKVPDRTVQNTAREAQQTLDQLKNTTEQEGARQAFGQPLHDALSGQSKAELDAKLNQLQQAQNEATQKEQAANAKAGLDRVRQAFEASQPKSLQAARQTDSLQPGQQDPFGQGMAELDSLRQQLESHRPVPPADQKKQGQQALLNLQTGMRSQFGDNSEGNQLLQKLGQMVNESGLDPGDLKRLIDQLQRFAVEASERLAKKQDQPELANIDPARLPPAYRGRIQKYFQKLSEP